MMVLNMDSKRQSCPNVLGDIGDVSTAFSYGISQKAKKDFYWEKGGLDYGFLTPEESEYNYISGFCQERVAEFDVSDTGFSPWFSVDMLHNRENTNPNSINFVSEFDMLDETIKPELEFAFVPQKRVLANKGMRSKRCKRTAFGGYWNSEVIPQTFNKDENENECSRKDVLGFGSNPCLNVNATRSSNYRTSVSSEKACETDAHKLTSNPLSRRSSGEIRKEGDNSLSAESFSRYDSLEGCGSAVISVGKWLNDLGFGKYADLFERHEVDEDALPLLTLEDLKEMGIVAVGPRRKLYTAIRQLRTKA